jgi:hypothetical protein
LPRHQLPVLPARHRARRKALIGSKVKLTFEATPSAGQKVPEWQVIW